MVTLAFTRIVKLLVLKFYQLVSVDAIEPGDISWYWNTVMEFSIEAQLEDNLGSFILIHVIRNVYVKLPQRK